MIMLDKILFWGAVVFFSIAFLSLLILMIIDIIYGDPKTITADPTDPILEKGYGKYMEKEKYEMYRSVVGKVHLTGSLCMLIAFVLSGLRWYIRNRVSS